MEQKEEQEEGGKRQQQQHQALIGGGIATTTSSRMCISVSHVFGEGGRIEGPKKEIFYYLLLDKYHQKEKFRSSGEKLRLVFIEFFPPPAPPFPSPLFFASLTFLYRKACVSVHEKSLLQPFR